MPVKKFRSKWTPLHFDRREGSNDYWICRCECGTERSVRLLTVVKNVSLSCRECYPTGKDHYAWKGYGELPKDVYNTYKHGAAAKGLPFELTIQQLWRLFVKQNGKCALTGWPLTFNKTYRSKTEKTASPDRIDSSKGYVKGNVQWVHRDINKMKKNIGRERFMELCLAVAKQHKRSKKCG